LSAWIAPGPPVTAQQPIADPPYFTSAQAANAAVSSCRTWTNSASSRSGRAVKNPPMPSPG
jgi:hypothetical protein